MNVPRSSIAEIVWPAIPGHAEAVLMALQYQLEQTQWWPAETLLSLQFRQLETLLRHAHETVPYYHQRLDATWLNQPLAPENWLQVPLLTRQDFQDRQSELLSTNIPQSHGNTVQKQTSGSTGRQLSVIDTDANRLYWMAITLRDHLWHRRDVSGNLVAIRSGRSAQDPLKVSDGSNWGPSTGKIYETGPSTVFYHLLPIAQQAELLQARQPTYLLLYPSNALRLAEYFRTRDLMLPSLQEVMTYGELLLPEVRDACRQTWNVPVSDMYSCEEAGYIALQCPESDVYHCQSESLLVEVLHDDGTLCAPGEIGKDVLTSLHNFAMPLIRYENLDYAEVGQPCACGRGLPVLRRILGRKRNMAVGADGQRFWPAVSAEIWSTIEGARDVQLIQTDKDRIDVGVVSDTALEPTQEDQLTTNLRQALGQPYSFSFTHQHEITRHANGKYERFICQVE